VTVSIKSGRGRTIRRDGRRALFGTASPHCGAWTTLGAGAVALLMHGAAVAETAARTNDAALDEASEVSEVVVTAHSSELSGKAKLEKIPGAFSIISGADVDKGRVQTNADLLKLTPGVIAEATDAGGLTAIKVSIRGSGVNNGVGYFRAGIKYEYDDLPVTTPGGDPYELFDPTALNATEVLPGDNAFTTGALALGGTVNFISNTGRTAPYTELRAEGGSFGYGKGAAATGGVEGPWDYYILLSGASRTGFENHSDANTEHVSANLGYQINPNIETRLYIHYGRDYFEGPGPLTQGQIQTNPTQANLTYLETNYSRLQPGSVLVGDVTKIKLSENQSLETGIAFQNYPILIGPTSTSAPTQSYYYYGDIAAQIKYENKASVFGHRNDLTVAAYWSDDIYGGDKVSALAADNTHPFGTSYQGHAIAPTTYYGIPNVKPGVLYQFVVSGSTDEIALISDDFEIVKNVWLTVGGGFADVPRNYYVTGQSVGGGISSARLNQNNEYFIPRLGLRWEVNHNLQLFTSYGGNVEPKQDWQGAYGPSTNAALYPNWNVFNLQPQVTNTFEVGLRGRYGIVQGSADVFTSQVRHELITTTVPGTQVSTTQNAPPSTHQGVEASVDTLLWQEGGGGWAVSDPGHAKLHLVQVYDWNDFHFNGDPQFHHNKEPGLPRNYYQAELALDHPSGVFGNLNLRYSDGVYTDYLNTFETRSYTTGGLTIGWKQRRPDKKGWQVSFSVDNITDKKYAVAVAPTYNAAHADAAVEYPGDGRGYFAVLDYKY
jgi:iron complex outermembrane receptor protein